MTAREGSGQGRPSRWAAVPRRGLARLSRGLGFGAADRTAAPVGTRPRPEIAQALFISEQTTKTHVSRILQKLSLRDRVQAVVFGYETGLVKPGSRS